MTDLDEINKKLKSHGEEKKEYLDKINLELAKLEAEKKETLRVLEEERIGHWLNARLIIPPVINREYVEHKIEELYEALQFPYPGYVVFHGGPLGFGRYNNSYYGHSSRRKTVSGRIKLLTQLTDEPKVISDPFGPSYVNAHQVLWRVPKVDQKNAKYLQALLEHCVDLAPANDYVAVLEKPLEVHFTTRYQLHREDGPAIIWRDGYREYWLNGVKVTRDLIEGVPTLAKIKYERNAERKRILIERFGYERYLEESKAKLLNEDKTGKLWTIPRRRIRVGYTSHWSEHEYYVEVLNSTPEPDGSVRRFFIRVPPTMKTAKEAVAWTFKKDHKSYKPSKEA